MEVNVRFIDLTHSLHSDIANWDVDCGFNMHVINDYSDCNASVKFKIQSIECKSGIGTHIDAPSHCIEDGKNVDEIELKQLIVPCVVIDLSEIITTDDYIITINDIYNFENIHGVIHGNNFVVIRTGWDKYWNNPEKYRNGLIFPSIDATVAEYLLDKNIAGLGVDTLSPDVFNSEFSVHKILLGGGKYIVENVANSSQMPPVGGSVIILPVKIKGGTEAPVRLVGLLN